MYIYIYIICVHIHIYIYTYYLHGLSAQNLWLRERLDPPGLSRLEPVAMQRLLLASAAWAVVRAPLGDRKIGREEGGIQETWVWLKARPFAEAYFVVSLVGCERNLSLLMFVFNTQRLQFDGFRAFKESGFETRNQ